mmetsp:Transcript_39185/g.73056  ORF Transcript_39185/g.73056 Transcript_39185/m.73056 type:complete len:295 (-) Transcript_39185:37-921(-)
MEAPGARTAWAAEEESSEHVGVARQQAQRHLREVLEESFARWVLVFSLVLCLMIPAMLTLFLWMLVSLVRDFQADCDAPLQVWVILVCLNVSYHVNWCGAGSVHSLILKKCCRFNAENSEVMPQHVTFYNLFVTLLIFVWHCLGLHWVLMSENCQELAPDLYMSVKVFAAFSIAFNVFVYLNTVGIYTIMLIMMRNGLLHSEKAAPDGTLELQEVVQYDAELFKQQQECCICMAEFDDRQEIRRTTCGHNFHSKCLLGWLKVNHTCPLCRDDLAHSKVETATIGAPTEVEVGPV